MPLLLRLAWRNVWRNRRRTLLTIASVLFATLLTVGMKGLTIGTWDANIRNTLESWSGYLQVQPHDYQDNPSLAKNLPYPGPADGAIAGDERITGAAPRIQADGLISFRQQSSGAALFGIDPETERRVTRFHERVRNGRLPDHEHPYDIAAGATLLDNLKAGIGDTVVILAQGADGVMGNLRFRVSGVLKFGSEEMDGLAVAMDLGAAQELLAMQGRVSLLAVCARDLDGVTDIRDDLAARLRARGIAALDVLAWEQVLPELKQSLEFDQIGDVFIYGILIIVVAFGILNSLLMSVTERFREFGISLAIGMQNRQLVGLVFLESAIIAALGIVLGAGAGYAINAGMAGTPIPLSGDFAKMYEEYGFLPQFFFSGKLSIPIIIAAIMSAVSLLSCLYPAYRVGRLQPLKGIRHT